MLIILDIFFNISTLIISPKVVYLGSLETLFGCHKFQNINVIFWKGVSYDTAKTIVNDFKNIKIDRDVLQLVNYNILDPELLEHTRKNRTLWTRHPQLYFNSFFENYHVGMSTSTNYSSNGYVDIGLKDFTNRRREQFISTNLHVLSYNEANIRYPNFNENLYESSLNDEYKKISDFLKERIENIII